MAGGIELADSRAAQWVAGRVEWVGEKSFVATGPMRRGLVTSYGPVAIVQVGGTWVQLVSEHESLIDEDPIIQFGRKVEDFRIIVSKSKTHFRAVYEQIAGEIIVVDAPAYSRADLSVFDYRNVPRGVYPVTKKS